MDRDQPGKRVHQAGRSWSCWSRLVLGWATTLPPGGEPDSRRPRSGRSAARHGPRVVEQGQRPSDRRRPRQPRSRQKGCKALRCRTSRADVAALTSDGRYAASQRAPRIAPDQRGDVAVPADPVAPQLVDPPGRRGRRHRHPPDRQLVAVDQRVQLGDQGCCTASMSRWRRGRRTRPALVGTGRVASVTATAYRSAAPPGRPRGQHWPLRGGGARCCRTRRRLVRVSRHPPRRQPVERRRRGARTDPSSPWRRPGRARSANAASSARWSAPRSPRTPRPDRGECGQPRARRRRGSVVAAGPWRGRLR